MWYTQIICIIFLVFRGTNAVILPVRCAMCICKVFHWKKSNPGPLSSLKCFHWTTTSWDTFLLPTQRFPCKWLHTNHCFPGISSVKLTLLIITKNTNFQHMNFWILDLKNRLQTVKHFYNHSANSNYFLWVLHCLFIFLFLVRLKNCSDFLFPGVLYNMQRCKPVRSPAQVKKVLPNVSSYRLALFILSLILPARLSPYTLSKMMGRMS